MAEPLSEERIHYWEKVIEANEMARAGVIKSLYETRITVDTLAELLATIHRDRERIGELEADIARRQRNDQIWWEACRCAEHPDVNTRGNNMWGCPDCLELIKHDNAQMETALRAARAWIIEVLVSENEASPENSHTVRQIDDALAGAKEEASNG